jgi:hypothetical protein
MDGKGRLIHVADPRQRGFDAVRFLYRAKVAE